MNTTPRFQLGHVLMTRGAADALKDSGQHPFEFLVRHQCGDWGCVPKEDAEENELSLREGFRIISAYRTSKGVRLWCITEWTRESTTLLTPEEY